MKVITAPNVYQPTNDEVSVFLAGGICNCSDWQSAILVRLAQMDTDNLVVFNPRREKFPIGDPSAAYEQIEWEFKALEKADIFSMYFASGVSDQPICMYELGRNIVRMQDRHPADWASRLIISVENAYLRKQDVLIQTELACGNLYVNAHEGTKVLQDKHAEMIFKAYKRFV